MKHKFTVKTMEQLERMLTQVRKMEIPINGWSVTVEEFKNNRSLAQNRMLFGQVYPPITEQIGEYTGSHVTKDQLHDFFKSMFSPRVEICVMGRKLNVPKSTTKFTKQEFSDFIEKIYAWGTDNGVWFT